MKRILLLLIIPAMFCACEALTGEEIGRLPINQITNEGHQVIKEVSLDLLQGDEIALWSDMDFKYEGDLGIAFRIQILKDGEELTFLEVDPRDKNITMNEVKTDVMGKIDWRYMGKNTSVTIDEPGKYTFRVALISDGNPTLEVKKAELVMKK